MPDGKEHVNSIGMKLVRIEPGSFKMGWKQTPLPKAMAFLAHLHNGDFDESPVHNVTISKAFYTGAFEVTNAQYEQFDPSHKALRGKLGYSKEDDEAVVFVSWHETRAFCEWLSKKEGLPYRLPTEAEWEYACRAGTDSHFNFGDELPEGIRKTARRSWFPDGQNAADVISLKVGRFPPNAWGLCDMHGNVEEWCADWHGQYSAADQTDPAGRADGDFRVTRGGSVFTEPYYMRSVNRAGNLPDDRNWLIGFRIVLGEAPKTPLLQAVAFQPNATNVSQIICDWSGGPDAEKPYFAGPIQYVKIPDGSMGPMYSHHNHDPAIVDCPNGDLLAIWYTCVEESGRELGILASRLRKGAGEWEPASPFWDAPDRNDHAPALWSDGKGAIYHFNGLSAAATWGNLVTIMRVSTDSGATWSKAKIIVPEHGLRHMPVESVFRTKEGYIIIPCDAVTGGNGGTAIQVSRDDGATWSDPGGKTAGIHAGIVQLTGGRLMALGRGDSVDGMMPKSVSSDMGKTWEYSASLFPPISGGQRLVLMRLREGPILLCSFAKEIAVKDVSGKERNVTGLYAALSFDEGETWPTRRLVSDDGPGRKVETTDGKEFTMGFSSAEPRGYLSVCQSPDGVVHLIGSRQHYRFNLAWLKSPPPAEPAR